MKRLLVFFLAANLIALGFSLPAHAGGIAGTKCVSLGAKTISKAKTYTCIKIGTRLYWTLGSKTISVKPTPTPTATRSTSPTPTLTPSAAPSASPTPSTIIEKPVVDGLTIGNLLWADEFKGLFRSAIDSTKWVARNCHRVPANGGGACFDGEDQFYAPSAIKLDGSTSGVAVINTTRINGSKPSDAGICLSVSCHFVSGRFDTQGKALFQYGYIEARIKMPVGSGNHPAFWMLGNSINQVGWPLSGEMDITEIHSNDPFVSTAATHYSTSATPNICCDNHFYTWAGLNMGVDLTLDYHSYAIAWLPNQVSYYVDGRKVSTTTPVDLGGYWHFNDKFFLILNNAVNTIFSGSSDNLQSSTMSIDWVRAYQLNGYGTVTTR